MLMLISAALAEQILCQGWQVFDTVPAAGATDIPALVQPVVIGTSLCGVGPVWSIELIEVNESENITLQSEEVTFSENLFYFTFTVPLKADKSYLLQGLADQTSGTFDVPFTTSSASIVPITEPPLLSLEPASWFRKDGVLRISGTVTPQIESATSFLTVETEAGETVWAGAAGSFYVSRTTDYADELCLVPRQHDGGGSSVTGDVVCIGVERGCSHISPVSMLLPLLASASLVRLRSRSNS